MILKAPHKYSIEKLYHFTCGVCKKWWSIADFQEVEGFESIHKITCPHCGYAQTMERIKDDYLHPPRVSKDQVEALKEVVDQLERIKLSREDRSKRLGINLYDDPA